MNKQMVKGLKVCGKVVAGSLAFIGTASIISEIKDLRKTHLYPSEDLVYALNAILVLNESVFKNHGLERLNLYIDSNYSDDTILSTYGGKLEGTIVAMKVKNFGSKNDIIIYTNNFRSIKEIMLSYVSACIRMTLDNVLDDRTTEFIARRYIREMNLSVKF